MIEAKSMEKLMFNSGNLITVVPNGEVLSVGYPSPNEWKTSRSEKKSLISNSHIYNFMSLRCRSCLYKQEHLCLPSTHATSRNFTHWTMLNLACSTVMCGALFTYRNFHKMPNMVGYIPLKVLLARRSYYKIMTNDIENKDNTIHTLLTLWQKCNIPRSPLAWSRCMTSTWTGQRLSGWFL